MYSRNRLSISISLQRDLALLFTELLSVISVDPHVVILIVMVVVIVLVNIVEHSAVRESDVSLRSWWRQKNELRESEYWIYIPRVDTSVVKCDLFLK